MRNLKYWLDMFKAYRDRNREILKSNSWSRGTYTQKYLSNMENLSVNIANAFNKKESTYDIQKYVVDVAIPYVAELNKHLTRSANHVVYNTT